MTVANPYFINIQLFFADGSRPNKNQIARVRAFDVNGAVITDEGQSGFDPSSGGWQPVFMQNIAAFSPPRDQPNLRFDVWNTAEQRVHSSQVFPSIASGSTVKIVIGQSAEIVGSVGSLTFTGNAKLIVHAKTAVKEQRYLIEAAQNPGTLAGTLAASYNIVASGETPWRLRLQQKEGAAFVDRTLILGPTTTQGDTRIQFLVPADKEDITLRMEQTVTQPGTGTTFGMVVGVVRQSSGQPLADVTVSLLARKARGGDSLLGDPLKTGADGSYTVIYKRTKPTYDLYIQVTRNQETLGTSGVIMNAGLNEAIDLAIGGELQQPSDFDRNRTALDAVLSGEGLQLSDLAQSTEAELALFSLRSGVQPVDLVLLKQSVTLAQQTSIAPEVFFGLGRQHIPLTLPAILAQDPEVRGAALDRALASNLIPEAKRPDVQAALAKFQQLSVDTALKDPVAPGETTLGGLLATAGLPVAKRKALVDTFVAHTGTTPEFWAKITQTGVLTAQEAGKAQFSLQLGVLTQNHLPLVQAVLSRSIGDLKSLTQFDQSGWLGLVRSQVGGRAVGVPADLAAAGVTDVDYARMLFTVVEDALPTAMLARKASSLPRSQTLTEFYSRNATYEMRSMTVNAFLRDNPSAVDFVSNPAERAAFVGQLKGMERIFRLAPAGARTNTVLTLVNAGIDSAFQIQTIGRSSFVGSFSTLLGTTEANQVFARATQATTMSALLVTRYSAAANRNAFPVIGQRPSSVTALPDYQTLFGSLDFCSCEHCQSAVGPAAYLVDVLHWLDTRPHNAGNQTPLTVLFQDRRADLGTIELSCKNTNTPLPYLDLVNEVLELQVAPAESPPAYQTRGEAGDLAAHPEHLRTEAYETLANAVYPFNLPFNLWLAEARTYLEHLGVPRHALMEAFQSAGIGSALTDSAVARETLELSALEADLIGGKALTPPRTTQSFWGLSGDANWLTELRSLAFFMTRAAPPLSRDGMPYTELTDLWRTSFVQSAGAVGIWFNGVTCDTKNAILPGLSQSHLERIHRFVRLRRHLDWPAADLDRAIQVLGQGELSEALLVKLASVQRLQTELRLERPELLSWWGPLDTRRWAKRLVTGVPVGAPAGTAGLGFVFNAVLTPTAVEAEDQSFYDRLFLSRSVESEPNSSFHVRPDGLALVDETVELSSQFPTLAAALGITADDLGKLVPLLPNSRLSLANLSSLYRHVSLAHALGIDAGALVTLLALTGRNPFDAAHPDHAELFVTEVRAVRASGFTVAELDYLLRHFDTQPASLEPDGAAIGVFLLELRDLLRKVLADNREPPVEADADQLRERLARDLAKVLPADRVTPVLSLIDLGANLAPPAGAESLIDEFLAFFLDPTAAKNALARPSAANYLSDRVQRLRFVLGPLVQFRRTQATRAAVIEKLSVGLGLDPAVAAPVLGKFRFPPGTGGTSTVDLFSDALLLGYDLKDAASDAPRVPTRSDFPAQFGAYTLLHKVALVLSRFRISKDEVRWVFELGPTRGTLDFQTLPIARGVSGAAEYAAWTRLRDAFTLRDHVTGGRLFDLFEAAVAAQAGDANARAAAFELMLGELVKRTRWNRQDIEFLVGAPARGVTPAKPSALALVYPDDFQDEQALQIVASVMATVRHIGLAAETLWPWRLIPSTLSEQAEQARDIKQAVRARLGDARWRESTRTLRDRLREEQRDALAGYLIAFAGFANVFALFDKLLIDVEMSACQTTSRIKQAIGSVQLFVQRALLNGEPDVHFQAGDAREWKWLKSFRVWEANRKVFLYPENYIEPELRDDKTPFFKELEDELLQGDLNDESAEQAVQGYLEKLDDVARLEIAGVCSHVEDETNVLHVFGRTRSAPHRYFHRQWVDGTHFTPWQKVELDIESDQLVPVVHNRRLYLFWPLITEAAVEELIDTPVDGRLNTQKIPEKYLQIRLAWSEQRHGKWAGKKLSSGQIGATDADYRRLQSALTRTSATSRDKVFLVTSESGADLLIEPVRCKEETIASQPSPFVRGNPRTITISAGYDRMDRFRLSGCDGTMTLERNPGDVDVTVQRPEGTVVLNQTFASAVVNNGLVLPIQTGVTYTFTDRNTLDKTPSPFSIVPVRQTGGWSALPFFFEDRERTFFVVPRPPPLPRRTLDTLPSFGNNGVPVDLYRGIQDVPVLVVQRPRIPRPDPRSLDPRTTVGNPIELSFSTNTRLLAPVDLSRRGGPLLDSLATPVLNALGSTAGTLAEDTIAFAPNQLSLRALSSVVSADRTFDFTSRSALGTVNASIFKEIVLPPSIAPSGPPAPTKLVPSTEQPFLFRSFYHPFVRQMRSQLNRFGLNGLLDPVPDGAAPELVRQQLFRKFFEATYAPRAVAKPFPEENFDFSYGGAYSAYNWELFFHVPFLVAVSLTKNRRFEEALRWFHFIFDPTESDNQPAPQRVWKVRPFFELFHGEDVAAGPIYELLLLLQYNGSDPEKLDAKANLVEQIAALSKDPFNPHAIARLRLVAYQKAVVIRYLDNLIEWGDELFRRDTIESINEATLLYTLAARLLGQRPREVALEASAPRTFNELRGRLDAFSNALVEIEGYLSATSATAAGGAENDQPVLGRTLFFCTPPNDKLIADSWDRVEDRLFKIRHCMNIEGVVRQLPLFEPPIDPALLVRAAAAGIDLGSVLNDIGGALPLQRYPILGQRALELCNDVRGLGQALLAALEKKDAEALSLLRSDQEQRLLNAATQVRQQQIDEAKEQLESLRRSRETAEIRLRYYRSRTFMNAAEKTQFGLLVDAGLLDVSAGVVNLFASVAAAVPDFEAGVAGFGGSPVANAKIGGTTVSNVASKVAEGLRVGASALDRAGTLSGILGSHERRADEWQFLGDQAQKEIEQIDRQILGAEIRVAIAEKELDNHQLQIEQAREVEDFQRSKFTNEQLYGWMVGQISSLYFQSYQLAYDVARRAERAWQFELAQPTKNFVQFGYWDGLKKGLLAGDRLYFDIQRMATAYLEENRREYELTRHVSLRLLDPMALLSLRRDGQCFVRIPEAWFDLDSPGHYLRRIKTVAVTIPSVTGPYVSVRLTLTLVSSSMRTTPDATAPYHRNPTNDLRFRDNVVGIQSIVTSSGQADSGLFETNLRDERYLPFEGAGAISEWHLELPSQFRQFDYDSISDIILHLRYTAREGGAALRAAAQNELSQTLRDLVLESLETRAPGQREGLLQLIDVASDQPDLWHRFLHPPEAEPNQSLTLSLAPEIFPFGVASATLGITSLDLFLVLRDNAAYARETAIRLRVTPSSGPAQTLTLTSTAGGLPQGVAQYGGSTPKPVGNWTLLFDETDNTGAAPSALITVNGHRRLNPAAIRNLFVAVRFKV